MGTEGPKKQCRSFPIFYPSKELYIILQTEEKNAGVIPPKMAITAKVLGILKFPNNFYLAISLTSGSPNLTKIEQILHEL